MYESVMRNEGYTPNEVSGMVVDAIIRHVGDYANLHGQGWLDIEETLRAAFSDIVDVEEDLYAGVIKVRTIKKG
jgi:hypothetical protein